MGYKYVLPLLGLALIALGVVHGGWTLLLIWLGANFVVLGLAHWRHAHHLFGKRPDGTVPTWSWVLFLPYLLYYGAVWHLIRFLSREPALSPVSDQLVVGCRLRAAELKENFDNYVDLTSEVIEPAAIRCVPGYRCFPLLDGSAPTPEALLESIASLRPGRTFIHCAQGHGRSGLYALALLLYSGQARTVEEGLQKLRAARPGVCLNGEQRRCIRAFAQLLASRNSAPR